METKWTPGPWWVVETDAETYVRDEGGLIASGPRPSRYDGQQERFITETDQYKSNAYLIASAPELYEALDNVRDEIAELHSEFLNAHALFIDDAPDVGSLSAEDAREYTRLGLMLAHVDAALRKARGE